MSAGVVAAKGNKDSADEYYNAAKSPTMEDLERRKRAASTKTIEWFDSFDKEEHLFVAALAPAAARKRVRISSEAAMLSQGGTVTNVPTKPANNEEDY